MSTTFASSSSSAGESPSKRSRDGSEMPEDADESAQAKIARKEARVIRNRESAQRSRNQRKQYLAGLEVRNRELEEEVRRLRGESPATQAEVSPATVSPSTPQDRSPEHTVLTLAGELGIPPQMVSSGVNLSSVAPPPNDTDAEIQVKQEPIIASVTNTEMDKLVSQNKALTQRVLMLENLLKQVVAVSNLGGLQPIVTQPTTVDTLPVHQPPSAVDETFDFNSFIQSNTSDIASTPTSSFVPTTPSDSNENSTSFYPVACHSAAGEGEQKPVGLTFDHQGTIGQGSESLGGFGRIEGMDFADSFFNADNTNVEGGSGMGLGLGLETNEHVSSFTDAEQGYEAQAQAWDEGMSALLADLEGRISEGQGQKMMEQTQEQEVWNPDSWMWETVPV